MTRRWLLILMALSFCCFHCTTTETTYPNAPIIFISVDTLRSDHLSLYGYQGLQTPAFDALGKDSLVFDRAYAHVPLTLPSHSSMFTGLLPPNHGVRDNTGYALDSKWETLAELLQKEGYATGGVISGMVLRQATGISQGFDFYEDELDTQSKDRIRRYAFRRGDASVDLARAWLDKQGQDPFFLFLHLYDPHTPYAAPAPFTNKGQSAYDGEIAYVDHLLAGFFKHLKDRGIYDRALIVLTSDHGEALGEHGEDEHGIFAYRETIQVPLIVKFPNSARAGERRDHPVGSIDLFPSILETLGLDHPPNDGRNIFGPKETAEGRPIYAETLSPLNSFGWCATRSVVAGDLHYLQICDPELYDLQVDPGSLNNLIGKQKVPKTVFQTLDQLGEGLQTTVTNSAEELELLASLGYAGGAVGFSTDRALDPHQEIKVFRQLDGVRTQLETKQFAQATAVLVPMLERNPALNDARYMLIQALTEQGKLEEAEYATLEGLGLFPHQLNFLLALTNQKLRKGALEEAVTAATRAFEVDPDTAGAQLLLPLFEKGGPCATLAVEQAQQILSKFSDSSLSAPYAYFVVGRHARHQGQLPQAVQALQKGLALKERIHKPETLGFAHQALGDSLARMDRLDEALDHLQQAVKLTPNYANARVALSYIYASMNRPREAVGTMTSWLQAYPQRTNFERAAKAMAAMGLRSQAEAFQRAASEAVE